MDLKKIKIKVDCGKKKIKYMSIFDILLDIGFHKDEITNNFIKNKKIILRKQLIINNFIVRYTYHRGYLCGYVDKYSKKIPKKFNKDKYKKLFIKKNKITLETLSSKKSSKIYIPKGDYTAPFGFDCGHADDISLLEHNNKNNWSEQTFKSRQFVINELDKITKSLIKYLSK